MRGRNAIHLNVSPFRGPNATQVTPVNIKSYATNGIVSGSPIYDKDNNVIFGSDDKNLYRVRYDLTFSTSYAAGGAIKSTPLVMVLLLYSEHRRSARTKPSCILVQTTMQCLQSVSPLGHRFGRTKPVIKCALM